MESYVHTYIHAYTGTHTYVCKCKYTYCILNIYIFIYAQTCLCVDVVSLISRSIQLFRVDHQPPCTTRPRHHTCRTCCAGRVHVPTKTCPRPHVPPSDRTQRGLGHGCQAVENNERLVDLKSGGFAFKDPSAALAVCRWIHNSQCFLLDMDMGYIGASQFS